MKTPYEVWLDYVASQKCVLCQKLILDYPFMQHPEEEEFVHKNCLIQQQELAA